MLKLSFVLPGEIWRKIVKTAEKLDEKLCHKKKKVCFFFSVRKVSRGDSKVFFSFAVQNGEFLRKCCSLN